MCFVEQLLNVLYIVNTIGIGAVYVLPTFMLSRLDYSYIQAPRKTSVCPHLCCSTLTHTFYHNNIAHVLQRLNVGLLHRAAYRSCLSLSHTKPSSAFHHISQSSFTSTLLRAILARLMQTSCFHSPGLSSEPVNFHF